MESAIRLPFSAHLFSHRLLSSCCESVDTQSSFGGELGSVKAEVASCSTGMDWSNYEIQQLWKILSTMRKKNCIVNVERAWVASSTVSMMLQLL